MTSGFPPLGQGVINEAIIYPDEILASMQGLEKLPGGVIIGDGSRTRPVRVGEILAQLTADVPNVGDDNTYIPRKATELAATAAEGQSDLTVDDSWPFEVGDTITIMDGSNEVIASINRSTHVITIVGNITTDGTDPRELNARVWVPASGQWRTDCIAGERYTPSATLSGITGRVSVYIGGLFKLAKLKGSASGLDVAARAALNGQDIAAPEGTLVRVRLGDPTDLS